MKSMGMKSPETACIDAMGLMTSAEWWLEL
jgi:hypothetical protein